MEPIIEGLIQSKLSSTLRYLVWGGVDYALKFENMYARINIAECCSYYLNQK